MTSADGQPELAPTAVICAAPSLGLVLVETTRAAGYEVVEVTERGMLGAASAANLKPDVAIIDVAVAGALGVEVVSLIRKLTPDTDVIAIVPFPALSRTLVDLGAAAVLVENDLRLLPAILREAQLPAPSVAGSVMTNPPRPPGPLPPGL